MAKFIPRFGHLPYVMGEGNKKLSKRDPEANLFHHRDRGFLPEGLLNYLALLGWSIAPDRDIFTMEEMCAAFDVADVNPNPARFDLKKAEAINGEHMRLLEPEDFASRLVPYLQRAELVATPPTDAQAELIRQAAPLVQSRMQLLGEAPDMLGFLFVTACELEFQEDGLKTLKDGALDVLAATAEALEGVTDWATASIEAAMRAKLIDELGIKPRLAFGPARVALSGRRISPPLFESMELLGRDETLARIQKLRDHLGA